MPWSDAWQASLQLLQPFTPCIGLPASCFPAGANIGLFCLRLLLDPRLAPRLAVVHAFEPLPGTAAALQANLEAHGVADKVGVRLVLWCSRQLS